MHLLGHFLEQRSIASVTGIYRSERLLITITLLGRAGRLCLNH